jgi:hypothetical protein
VKLRVITPRKTVLAPEVPVLVNGRVAENTCPLVTVKLVAVPIAVPLLLRNEMAPEQDAAVPLAVLLARFTTLIWAVSELANPTTGKADVRVTVAVVVCAMPGTASVAAVKTVHANRPRIIVYLSL